MANISRIRFIEAASTQVDTSAFLKFMQQYARFLQAEVSKVMSVCPFATLNTSNATTGAFDYNITRTSGEIDTFRGEGAYALSGTGYLCPIGYTYKRAGSSYTYVSAGAFNPINFYDATEKAYIMEVDYVSGDGYFAVIGFNKTGLDSLVKSSVKVIYDKGAEMLLCHAYESSASYKAFFEYSNKHVKSLYAIPLSDALVSLAENEVFVASILSGEKVSNRIFSISGKTPVAGELPKLIEIGGVGSMLWLGIYGNNMAIKVD